MRYLLYLRRSLTRRPRRHITLWLLLACGVFLPLLASIYRDSAAYGRQQELLSRSQGQTFHIQNAEEADTAYFEDIPGLSPPVFRDGTIFLRILSDEEWQNSEMLAYYGGKVQEQAARAGEGRLNPKAYDYAYAHGILTDSLDLSEQRALLYAELFLLAVAALLFHSAYRSHLRRFSPEIGVLRALGAGQGQIMAIFLAEFLAMFLLAALAALALAVGVVWLLFRCFLEIREAGNLSWLIFHVDVRHTGALLLADFAVLAALPVGTLARYVRDPALTLLRGERQEALARRKRHRRLKRRRSPAASLAGLWRQRTNRSFADCLAVSVPITTVFLLLLSLLLLNARAASEPPEQAIRLTQVNAVWLGGFSQEDIAAVRALDGVAAVEAVRRVQEDRYQLQLPQDDEDPGPQEWPQARLRPYSALEGGALEGLDRNEAAVSARQEGQLFAAGDELTLCRANDDGSPGDETIRLTVVEAADVPASHWVMDVYISDALYGELAGREPVGTLEITLVRPEAHAQVAAALEKRFPGDGYELEDRQAASEAVTRSAGGMYLLLCSLFCALFLFTAVIVSAKLRDYIDSCRETARTLHALGGAKGDLYASYMGQTGTAAALAAALPALLCAPLWGGAADLSGWRELTGIAAAAAAAAAVAAGMYLLPVRKAAKSMLKQL